MTKTYVPIHNKPGGKVAVEPKATIGAVVGVNLVLADGTVLKASDILNSAVLQMLATVNGTAGVTAGQYGDGTHVGQFTVNVLGEITQAANIPITFPAAPTFASLYGSIPNVTGSRGGNAALASLLTGLAGKGIIIDSTTP